MPDIGDRVVVSDKIGTVKWKGRLPKLDSIRLGIEFDSPSPSRHNGCYDGSKVFSCRDECGVFVKECKVSHGCSILEALTNRYIMHESQNDVENLIGAKKIRERISKLANIELACLEKCMISTCGDLSEAFNIRRLRLSENLITRWSVVLSAVSQLHHLEDLDLTGNKLTISPHVNPTPVTCYNLRNLSLSATGLSWSDMVSCVSLTFPSLTSLTAESCKITSLQSTCPLPRFLTSLNVSDNLLCNLVTDVLEHLTDCPDLIHVDLSHNSVIDFDRLHNSQIPPKLESLNLSFNKLSSFDSVKVLSSSILGTKMTSLRLHDNPSLYSLVSSQDIVRFVLISSFPNLSLLNGATVSKTQLKLNAQRYCASSSEVERLCLIPINLLNELRETHGIFPNSLLRSPFGLSANRNSNQSQVAVTLKSNFSSISSSINFTVMPSLTVCLFTKILVRRLSWPMDMKDSEILVSPRLEGQGFSDVEEDAFSSIDLNSYNKPLSEVLPSSDILVIMRLK